MKVLENPFEIFSQLQFLRHEGKSIGLVPTMGALHAGHYSLVRRSVAECDVTVATIFVNPTQFGPNEDFSRYPRTTDQDLRGLRSCGCDFVFMPPSSAMYGPHHSTWVEPTSMASPLEGAFRPGHYRGVATIVLKLFHLIPATVAFFGRKDYQQLMVVRQMVDDLNVPIRVEGCPTVREVDGLAMSSRNRYLTPEERQRSVSLSQALRTSHHMFINGERSVAILEKSMQQILLAAPVTGIDYAKIVDAATLQDIETASESSIALIAARIGSTRLIDNLLFADPNFVFEVA